MRKILFTVLVLSLLLFSGCQKTTTETPTGTTVEIDNSAYSPKEITITKGTTVTWINKQSVSHTVTFDDKSMDASVYPNQIVTRTFDETGVFTYHCKMHPNMKGKVIVQ